MKVRKVCLWRHGALRCTVDSMTSTQLIAPCPPILTSRRLAVPDTAMVVRPLAWIRQLGERFTPRPSGRTDLGNQILDGMPSARSLHR